MSRDPWSSYRWCETGAEQTRAQERAPIDRLRVASGARARSGGWGLGVRKRRCSSRRPRLGARARRRRRAGRKIATTIPSSHQGHTCERSLSPCRAWRSSTRRSRIEHGRNARWAPAGGQYGTRSGQFVGNPSLSARGRRADCPARSLGLGYRRRLGLDRRATQTR